eukprot:CAMPEP_0172315638 /NCGR_PEP_ID=MMETSP1058-20130122/25830_1 /TAXON_ID=83371 /ORGANISM="Detonula confervacea, Strain CCMP 353" /LENGTH=639 /DNA_ID=CAMNT_0013029757 /DNA_START=301 /DNA_END=2217 /DNA_ORIENTATION=+
MMKLQSPDLAPPNGNNGADQHQQWPYQGRLGPFGVNTKNERSNKYHLLVKCHAQNDDEQHLIHFDPPGGIVFTYENFTEEVYISFKTKRETIPISCTTTKAPVATTALTKIEDGVPPNRTLRSDDADSSNTSVVASGQEWVSHTTLLNVSQVAFLLLIALSTVTGYFYRMNNNTTLENGRSKKRINKKIIERASNTSSTNDRRKRGKKRSGRKKKMGRRNAAAAADDDGTKQTMNDFAEGMDNNIISDPNNEENEEQEANNGLDVSFDSTSDAGSQDVNDGDHGETYPSIEETCKRNVRVDATTEIAIVSGVLESNYTQKIEIEANEEQVVDNEAALEISQCDNLEDSSNEKNQGGKYESNTRQAVVDDDEIDAEDVEHDVKETEGCNSSSKVLQENSALILSFEATLPIEETDQDCAPTKPESDSTITASYHSSKNSIVLFIKGMTCSGCVKVVDRVLNSFDAVDSTSTDLISCTSTVYYSISRLNLLQILTALDDVGMETYLESQTITSHGRPSNPNQSTNEAISIHSKQLGVIGEPPASSPLSLMDELRKGTTPLRRYQCSCGCEGCICSDRQVHKHDTGVDVTLTNLCNRLQDTLGMTTYNLEATFRESGGGDKELRDKLSNTTFPCGCGAKARN